MHYPAHPDEPQESGADKKYQRTQGSSLDQLAKAWNEKAGERRDNVSGGSFSFTHKWSFDGISLCVQRLLTQVQLALALR